MWKTGRLGRDDVEVRDSEVVYQGFFSMEKFRLRHRLFSGGWSREFTRELFVRSKAVGVLLYDPEHELIGLIEQFRVGAMATPGGPWLLEVVAGVAEVNEISQEVARRELSEEAGVKNARLVPICEYLVSPGGTNEIQELWCGLSDLRDGGGTFGLANENEDIKLHIIPEAEVMDWLAAGRCNNAATIICLQWLQMNRDRLHNGPVSGTV
ncbi:MAG: ADP-ribose diphosphatase [Gammaproteobacteria bacterium]|nr:MAG: ADP-ribose diphosphatase [Gammaproteobacteria bacterium]RLA49872.1 MAG: ADP-ribose diphosphatase [Gammaproteobacteria bacterium]